MHAINVFEPGTEASDLPSLDEENISVTLLGLYC